MGVLEIPPGFLNLALQVGSFVSKSGGEGPKKKIMTWILFVLFVGRHYCAVSSSFVCSADFLMRCFWRGMTERSACSVERGGAFKGNERISVHGYI